MVVHVDDFKLAGPATSIKEGWQLIRKGIRMDDPTNFGLYLGCYPKEFELKLKGATKGKARGMSYNMQAYLENTVKKYQTLAGPGFNSSPRQHPS